MGVSPSSPTTPAVPTRRAGRRRAAWGLGALALGLAGVAAALALTGGPALWLAERRAREAVEAGRFAEAQAPLDRWLSARPDSAEAHYLRGRALVGLDRPEDALRELDRARQLGHPEPPLERLAGIVLARGGLREAAEPLLLRARARAGTPDPEVEAALTRLYFEADRIQLAQRAVLRWAVAAPDDPTPWRWRAEIDARLRVVPRALADDYRNILRRDPGDDRARLGLAEALRDGGELAAAEAGFADYLRDHPDSADALAGLGRTAMGFGRMDEAAALLDRALDRDPRQPEALQARASIHMRRGEWAEALPLLDRAVEARPENPEAHFGRGLALKRLGRDAEADAEVAAANRIRRDTEALIHYRRELSLHPRDLALMAEAAEWMLLHDHEDEGLVWARRVLESPGSHPETARLLAEYYGREGDEAQANYYRLLAESPRDPQ
jgi:Flp pilus assembly protein TadD